MAIGILEQMFENKPLPSIPTFGRRPNGEAGIQMLRGRIKEIEGSNTDSSIFPVNSALLSLFPEGGLAKGASYSLDRSASLLWSLIAEPTRQGVWCAIVGVPDLGIGIAKELGVNTNRIVLIPTPGPKWMAILGDLIETVGICVLGSFSAPAARQLSALHSRLRSYKTSLLVRANWPNSKTSFAVAHQWNGAGLGEGLLQTHYLHITAKSRSGDVMRSCDVVINETGLHETSNLRPVINMPQILKAN